MMFQNSKKSVLLISVLLLAIGGLSFVKFPGSLGPFLLFNLCYLALLLLIFPQPRSYAYIFFAAFLFLGFWVKLMAHMLFNYSFLEPIGYFDGTGPSWDRVLVIASFASIGVIGVRVIHLLFIPRISADSSTASTVPRWYTKNTLLVWSVSCLLILGINAWNAYTAFYQIGVNPKLILPFHFNVLAAWLINIGFGIWLAIIIHWENLVNPRLFNVVLFAPIVEGLVSTTSTLSRSIYLSHSIPYLVVLLSEKISKELLPSISKKRFAVVLITGLVLSLFLVQVLRSATYFSAPSQISESSASENAASNMRPSTAPGVFDVVSNYFPEMTKQVGLMLVDRWIGLEGVLAVSSYPELGNTLFLNGLREDPRKGNNSYYQLISKSSYARSDRFTFLTLPGITAILYYSGSLLVVASGMFIVSLLMMATEAFAARYIGNVFLLSFVGLAMANVVCQLNFPYLGLIFFLQLWIALFFIWSLLAASARFGSKTEPQSN